MKRLWDAVTAKDAWVVGGIVVLVVADPVAASTVAGSAASSFMRQAKTRRSGAHGIGWEAR